MAEAKKGTCGGCDRPNCSVNADGTVRFHLTDRPECQDPADPDSRKCVGAGKPPKGAQAPVRTGYVCRVLECGRPVELTANRRARSHLMQDMTTPCPGGSDWPLRVDPKGNRHDTAPASEPSPAVGPEGLLIDDDESEPVGQLRLAGAFDPQDPDGPGCTHPEGFQDTADDLDCDGQDRVVSVCRLCGMVAPEDRGCGDCPDCNPSGFPEAGGAAADGPLPADCTHPRGFTYEDDGNGHSGSFCPVCGAGEPEPDWHTPADLLMRMPEGVRRTAESNPECWDCGHEITPRAVSFGWDSKVTHVVWECSRGFRACHPERDAEDGWCRPQLPEEARVADLDEGDCFVRHTARPPLNRLVYRAGTPVMGPLPATVVGTGPYAGRTGQLTNLQEEITCTDQHGRPRPRSTPSPPARPTPPSSAPSSRHSTTTGSAPPASASETAPSGPGTTSGPTGKAAGSTRSAPRRTALPDVFSTPKQSLKESDKYDSYGRYKLLHPDTGKPVKWTRATTFAKSVQDTYALSMWGQRMTLKGASLRPDIVAAVSTLEVKADKDRVNALVEDAKKAAGDKVAANKGTAVHAYTEDRDKILVGETVEARDVPEEFAPTVDAYEAILAAFGLEPVPGLIEFTTAVKQYEVAGTSDRVYKVTRDITFKLNKRTVTLYAGEYVVGDVKTGADLSYGWQEICIQLSLYCQGLNTSGVWDWGTGRWAKPVLPDNPGVLLKVRTDVGIVPHLPVDREGTGAPLATLYAIDLDAGWAAAVLCAQVRTWRKTRNLAVPLEVAHLAEEDPDTGRPVGAAPTPVSRPAVASRPATLEDRAKAVTTRAEASAVYQEAKAARVPVAEMKRLVAIMQEKLKSFVEQGA